VKSAPALVLWLLIALLPLNGYANAMANGCASHHRQASSMPMVHPADMALPGMHTHAGMHHAAANEHGGCPCPAVCIAHCAASATLASLNDGFVTNAARSETPADAGITATRPSPAFDLLRPPKTIGL
jgi:hypothetical protein